MTCWQVVDRRWDRVVLSSSDRGEAEFVARGMNALNDVDWYIVTEKEN